MKRKLIWLNLVLAGLVAAAGVRLHDEWAQQKAREEQIRKNSVKAAPPVPVAVATPPAPVTAAAYNDIAQKMIFSKDRNPTVVVEVKATPPPPPPPMPPLPVLRGVMGLPGELLALMSENAASRNIGVHVGDPIGPFKLVALTPDEITFQWTDKIVTRRVSEMMHNAPEAVAAAGSAPPINAPQVASQGPGKPGVEIVGASNGYKICTPGDTSPNGTIADGMRKVVVPNPFGSSCHWEPVQ